MLCDSSILQQLCMLRMLRVLQQRLRRSARVPHVASARQLSSQGTNLCL
jgi:hypothetical protein